MDKYLLKEKGLLPQQTSNGPSATVSLRKFIVNPLSHFVIFGALMVLVGILSNLKVLPYSFASGLASTFAYGIAAIGFCLLMGYSGLASLGTGGFIGIGTYCAHYIMGVLNLPFIIALALSVGVAILLGMAVGFISLRIEGIYLAILTLGLSEILRNLFIVVQDTVSLNHVMLFGITIPRSASIYVTTVLLVIVMLITHNLTVSPTGRAMLAMKNSTAAAQAMGVSLMKYRLLAFVLCTVYASLAGLMYMVVIRSAMASSASGLYALITSLNILAAVVIGGARSIWGTLFGTFIMYGMQTMFLNRIPFLQQNPVIITFIAGILVVVVVMFYPGGVAQLMIELKTAIKKLHKKAREGKYGKDI